MVKKDVSGPFYTVFLLDDQGKLHEKISYLSGRDSAAWWLEEHGETGEHYIIVPLYSVD
jgi:hypothetical protein